MKKNVNVGCVIDHENNKIVVSKEFLRKAGKVGSPEYKELLAAKKDFNTYTLETRTVKKGKSEKPHIDYKQMKEYIGHFEDAKNRLEVFERVKVVSHIQRNPYNYVRDWFLLTYMKWERDENNKIVPKNNSIANMEMMFCANDDENIFTVAA